MTTLRKLQRGLGEVGSALDRVELKIILEDEGVLGRLDDDGDLGLLAKELRRKMETSDMVLTPEYNAVVAAASADAGIDKRWESVAEALVEEANEHMVAKPRFGSATMKAASAALEEFERLRMRSLDISRGIAPTAERIARERAEDAEAARVTAEAAREYLQQHRTILKPERHDIATLHEASDTDLALRAQDRERRLQRLAKKRAKISASNSSEISIGALEAALSHLAPQKIIALVHLIASISSFPDDESRRRLRCSNPKFASDFGRPLDPQVQIALEAIGFRLVYRPKANDYLQLYDSDDDDEEPFLVLREPDPMTDLDAWSKWFDHLSACNARLQQEHQKQSAILRELQLHKDPAGSSEHHLSTQASISPQAVSILPAAYLPGKAPAWAIHNNNNNK